MFKKYKDLGKKLTRDEMREVKGGIVTPPPFCNHPSECGSGNNWDCVPGYVSYACVNGRCRVVNCS